MNNDLFHQTEIVQLEAINLKIAQAETDGDVNWLDQRLAPEFGFQKADKSFVGRAAFLAKVKQSGERSTVINSVAIFGNRALVTCVVTMQVDGMAKQFHNLRLFVKIADDWKLLGWANEALPSK